MINKELKKLSRRELVDIIYQLKKNEQQMQDEIASLKTALEEKRIKISNAGSIAQASLEITELLSTAQSTADLYLREVARMKEDTEKECAEMIEAAEKKANEILADSEKKLSESKACCQMQNTQQIQIKNKPMKPKKKRKGGRGHK